MNGSANLKKTKRRRKEFGCLAEVRAEGFRSDG